MAIQAYKPKQSSDGLGKVLTIGGAVAGGVMTGGSPQGIAMGAGLGQTAGGVFNKPQQQESGMVEAPQGALDRRLQELKQQPLAQIRESINSLQYVQDPQVRQQLAEPLMQADYMARMKGQV